MIDALSSLWRGRTAVQTVVTQLPDLPAEPPAGLGVLSGGFVAFLNSAPDGVLVTDSSGTICLANQRLHDMLRYPEGALVGRPLETLVPPASRGLHVALRRAYQAQPASRRMRERIATALRADGTEMAVDIGLGSVEMSGELMTFAFVRDASAQQELWDELLVAKKRLERELEDRRQYQALTEVLQTLRSRSELQSVLSLHMEHLFPLTGGAVYLADAAHAHVESIVTWGWRAQTRELTPDCCVALRTGMVHSAEDAGAACTHIERDSPWSMCVPLLADGTILGVFHVQVEPGVGVADESWVGEVRRRATDVAERLPLPLANIQLRERLLNQSVRDPLTGLLNRRQMDSVIVKEISRAHRLHYVLALGMVDLDHFKAFNDSYGHDAGDRLLREFAQFLASLSREDDVLFRFGGEEFVLIMPGATAAVARARIDEIGERWRRHPENASATSFSAGIAECPAHAATVQELLRAADGALYQAKSSGRDRVAVADSDHPRQGRPAAPESHEAAARPLNLTQRR